MGPRLYRKGNRTWLVQENTTMCFKIAIKEPQSNCLNTAHISSKLIRSQHFDFFLTISLDVKIDQSPCAAPACYRHIVAIDLLDSSLWCCCGLCGASNDIFFSLKTFVLTERPPVSGYIWHTCIVEDCRSVSIYRRGLSFAQFLIFTFRCN